MIIGIDFDGTVVTHEFPGIGKDIGAVPVLKKLVEKGHDLILFTMRSDIESPESDNPNITAIGGNYLTDAVNWFKERDIPLYGINTNPTQHLWTKSPKAYCELYIDDAGIGTPLLKGEDGGRDYVDWDRIEIILEYKGLI